MVNKILSRINAMNYTYKIEIVPSRERVMGGGWWRMHNWLKINHPEMML
jgi:hypothetical protein